MFSKKRISVVFGILMIASMVLAACAPATPAVQTIVVTQVVEKEGQTVVETQIVEVTPTPAPEETEPPPAAISPEFKNPDTYTVITGAGEQETLDPAWTYETRGSSVEANIYEGLVWFDRERTDSFVPALATEWTTSEDGLTWTFNVREGVKFHEGGTLEPHDIAYTNHRAMLQGRVDGPQWMTWEALFGPEYAVFSVKDFAAAYAGKDTFDELTPADLVSVCEAVKASVVADDEAGTVTFNLANPTPWFLSLAAQTFIGGTTDQEWMIENGAWDNDCETWQNWADPAAEDTILFNKANGTGPYKLDHWTPGEETVLVANEDYWRTEPMWEGGPSGPPQIKRVVLKDITEWGTRLSMLEAGDADWIYTPPPFFTQVEPYYKTVCHPDETCDENASGYIKVYTDNAVPAITPAQFNWTINTEGGNPFMGSGELDGNGIPADFFNDIHIRKAFNYCFDFDALIQDAINGSGQQPQGPIPQGMMGYREGEAPLYSYDPAKCEEEFKMADLNHNGVAAGDDTGDVWDLGFYFQIGYNTGNETRRIASEIIKAGVEGVNPSFNVAVVGMPWPVLLNSRRAGKLPIYVGGWLEDYHDPHNWVYAFLDSQGSYGRIVNMPEEIASEFDALIAEGASLSTVEERTPIYEEIQLKAEEEAVNIWMYQLLERYHFQEWIDGFYFNPAYGSPSYNWIYALSKQAP
ncbi:MAG: ABC transporter substrate-binding protein [Anaerolineales bacterium]|jgi:peptide/nickel transport system substrate-binding protein